MSPAELDVRAALACPRSLVVKVQSLARRFMDELGEGTATLSVLLVSDRAIQRLNRTWRRIDRPTDVLSFESAKGPVPRGAPRVLGDIVISLPTARRTAKAEGRRLDDQLGIYLAHGLLHLLGHDHHQPREAARMALAEERLLGAAGLVSRALDTIPKRSPTSRNARARRSRS